MDWRLLGTGGALALSAVVLASGLGQPQPELRGIQEFKKGGSLELAFQPSSNLPSLCLVVGLAIGAGVCVRAGMTESQPSEAAVHQLKELQSQGTKTATQPNTVDQVFSKETAMESVVHNYAGAMHDYYAQPQSTPTLQAESSPQPEEHQQIKALSREPTVLLYGGQGGGKTSKMGWLVGQKVSRGHRVDIVNPLAPYGFYKPLKVWGAGLDYGEAETGIKKFTSEAQRRLRDRGITPYNPFDDVHWCLALDEVTDYEDRISEAVMREFLSICTQYLRQANMSVIITSHGDTLACMGGAKAAAGKSNVLKRQFKRLLCQPVADESVPGGLRCSGHAFLKWMDGDVERSIRVEIPSWMQPPTKNYDFSSLLPKSAAKVLQFPKAANDSYSHQIEPDPWE